LIFVVIVYRLLHLFSLNSDYSFSTLLSSQSLLPSPPFIIKKLEPSYGYQPALSYGVAIRLGSSSLEDKPGNLFRRKGSKGRKQTQRQPLLLL